MPTATVYDMTGAEAGRIELADSVFGVEDHPVLVHQAVVAYEGAQRSGTASTKNRAEVSGTGSRPWRQKGTGRSRHGSTRTNIWRGGGVTFGPKPRSFRSDLPRKAKLAALRSALSSRLRDGKLRVVDGLVVRDGKTREVAAALAALGLGKGASCLLTLAEKDALLTRAARNVPNLSVKRAAEINAYDVMSVQHVLIGRDAVEALTQRLSS